MTLPSQSSTRDLLFLSVFKSALCLAMTADHVVLTASVFNGLGRNCTGYELVN